MYIPNVNVHLSSQLERLPRSKGVINIYNNSILINFYEEVYFFSIHCNINDFSIL